MTELILVGDRVLIAPDDADQQTKAGLYLPATVAEKEQVRSGRVVDVGPGYKITPNPDYSGDPWAAQREAVRYLPLQARPGDHAFFLRKEAIALTFEGNDYLILPHGAIVALVRKQEQDLPDAPDINIEDLLR